MTVKKINKTIALLTKKITRLQLQTKTFDESWFTFNALENFEKDSLHSHCLWSVDYVPLTSLMITNYDCIN